MCCAAFDLSHREMRTFGGIYGPGYRILRSHATACVQATQVGGTHPALVEAMGHGNAILANDVPEHRETLGDAGLYYRGLGELADQLQVLLDDSRLAGELRRRAYQRAGERFGWEAITDAYETWLRSLVDG